MGEYWSRDIIDAGKLPLLLCMVAFVVTFVITRVIVRMIRAGRGPFSDNTVGGVHVHHLVPGLGLVVLGGLVAIGSSGVDGWKAMAGVLFGMGLALVLDEFALILHLQDVYWEEEGRLSVDVVFILAGVMLLLVIGSSPLGTDTNGVELLVRIEFAVFLVIDLAMAVLAALKGKLITAVTGVFIPIVAWFGAIRLARPSSPWARRAYRNRPEKMTKATARDLRVDARWRSKVRRLRDFAAGTVGAGPES